MISAAFPGFLVAAGVLAAIPVALHFLARRPPGRAALPTARFLTEDPRTLLRLQRRPSDLSLLAVRVAFALALAASFAGLSWMPERSGAARVVLVDAGADPALSWADAVDAVRGAAEDAVRNPAGDAAIMVVAYGLDDGARVVEPTELGDLERGAVPATAEDGLRALREAARAGGFVEVEVTWVGHPSWRVWSSGLGLMREALWPGRVALRPVRASEAQAALSAETAEAGRVSAETGEAGHVSAETRDAPVALILPDPTTDSPLRRAIEAIGGQVVTAASTADWIFAEDATAATLQPLLGQARAGATLIVGGRVPPEPEGPGSLPWVVGSSVATASHSVRDRLVLPGDRAVGEPVVRLDGTPAPGARTLATFADAAPAAAARLLGEGCVVYLAASLTAPELTGSADYPSLLRSLVDGCADENGGDGPLDVGALQALERPELPATVDVASLVASDGYSLTRWLVLLALALLGLEVAMTRERRTPRQRPEGRP